MKGWVGVAGPRMSPARTAPLSNNRSLIKGPFTVPLLPPANAHSLRPILPTYSEPTTVATEKGNPPLLRPPPSSSTGMVGQTEEGEETTRYSQERLTKNPVVFAEPAQSSTELASRLQLKRPPGTPVQTSRKGSDRKSVV